MRPAGDDDDAPARPHCASSAQVRRHFFPSSHTFLSLRIAQGHFPCGQSVVFRLPLAYHHGPRRYAATFAPRASVGAGAALAAATGRPLVGAGGRSASQARGPC